MSRPDREDLAAQLEAARQARAQLAGWLTALEGAAHDAARVADSKAKRPPAIPLATVYEAVLRVQRAEEALDLATYDLHTAAGGDG